MIKTKEQIIKYFQSGIKETKDIDENEVTVIIEKVNELPSSISAAVLAKKFDKEPSESYAK